MNVEHVQTKREIEGLLAGGGLRPRKKWGQHFLIDGNLMRRLADSAEIQPTDLIIEVGGGTGGLTDLLITRAGRVVCVEIDYDLSGVLQGRFATSTNFTLLQGDVLERKHKIRPDLAEMLGESSLTSGESIKLVANLPYQIATPLVMNLLEHHPLVRRLCFTVQAEVGDRILAKPGTRDFGPLAILIQTLCETEIIARIGPQAFWPRPAVDSVMIRLIRREDLPLRLDQVGRFMDLVRSVFQHRRKTLRAALRFVLESGELGVHAEFEATRRPETLGPSEWHQLFRITVDESGN